MDGTHASTVLIRQFAHSSHDLQSNSTVQSRRGLIQKDQVWQMNNFHTNRKTLQLTTRDTLVHGVTHKTVLHVTNSEHVQEELHTTVTRSHCGALGHTCPGRVTDGLLHCEGGDVDVILQHIRRVAIEK